MKNNHLIKKDFLNLYEKRLQKIGIDKGLSKIVSVKIVDFLLKNILFYVLSGYEVQICKFGIFGTKEFSGSRYNMKKKIVEKYCEERITFRISRKLRLAIRGFD